jgi:LysR family transcriptional activator of nhaA
VVPNLAAEVDDMALIRLLARNGEGLAVIPPIVARDELASGRLVELAELPGITESFHAITLERKFPHPHIGAMLADFA